MNIADVTIPATEIPEQSPPAALSSEEEKELREKIKKLLKEKNGVLVAHYYTDKSLQELAEETGGCVADSLEMARFGARTDARTIIVAGVRFMGETAKILSMEKTVLMPDPEATCSLDTSCPQELFGSFCDRHPDRTVVVYANTSAHVKARADWVVTSGIALDVISHLHTKGEKILWAPDRHLGGYIQKTTGADMLLWPGSCVVHERFNAKALREMREKYPEAAVLVHPESPAEVVAQADYVGSTTGIIKSVVEGEADTFIIATDIGIFAKIRQLAPHKRLLPAPNAESDPACNSCAQCPWMGMNSLRNLEETLRTGGNEIHIPEALAAKARKPIQRMLDFAAR